MCQTVIAGFGSYRHLEEILEEVGSRKFLLVCGGSFSRLGLDGYFSSLKIPFETFSEFTPNPRYKAVCAGVRLFCETGCDAIVAVGGGSAIDVAKCIKLYCRMDHTQNYLTQPYADSGVPLIALPTTAGTGSESTRFSVMYYYGEKLSVQHDSILPDYAILEPGFLKTLPVYQKKCTLLDALCQAIESWWSVNSTDESKQDAKRAVETIMRYLDRYINENSAEAAEQIMLAANCAGRAINITQTTAPHAMSYKMTSLYGLPHGHSVALSLPEVWEYMLHHPELCTDSRGAEYLSGILSEIAASLSTPETMSAPEYFRSILARMGLQYPCSKNREMRLNKLVRSVNTDRLKNNPVSLDAAALRNLYERIVSR